MFKAADARTFSTAYIVECGNVPIGRLSVEYHAIHYDDIQLSSAGQATGVPADRERKYVLTSTTRIVLYNPQGIMVSPSTQRKRYENYPALLNIQMMVNDPQGELVDLQLIDYFPKTLNTQVQTSGTAGSSSGVVQSSSISNTVGSSTSETNSFSVSAGLFGEAFTMSATADHSTTTTHEHSNTTGSEASRNTGMDASNSASMSIKDWGAYGLVNPISALPVWNFGQEYPWNVFQSSTTDGTTNPNNPKQVLLQVPATMLARLWDGATLYPPSQLSSYGVNFATKVQWLVTIPAGGSPEVSFTHFVNYFSASHSVESESVAEPGDPAPVRVYMDAQPTMLGSKSQSTSVSLDLGVLSLAPITTRGGAAIVGFVPNKFTTLPAPQQDGAAPRPFLAFSGGSDLLVKDTTTYPKDTPDGAGFSATAGGMTGSLSGSCSQLSFRLLFKITNTVQNYSLFFKHWKIGDTGLKMSIVINEDTTNTVVRYIDDLEAEGGSSNTTVISLRNLAYSSLDYHDYLNLGLNSIDITLSPINSSGPSRYGLRALSIEAS
ncbi:hypothetical protein HLH34_18300 [Gluconacetobacter azotocaptans]|uniref:Uncharacterized protein n=1 Tax=Gluconacetobacter azotocaptans TaxID=142834 RepID=A0A7W4JVW3_9PROT|nr:hypothetical protein [Gluconacetobacter azotocaptans]MBB2191886.1 hypothetical protein [Gluconacetobacter azotocaptans]GBQ30613.1 hypothetical protein AA13594_1797 [Gluconacetobacter azotocaptans DSM 13594]